MSLYGGIELTGQPDLENVRKLDLLPMRSIREIERYGFAIDIPHLEMLTETLTKEMVELRRKICDQIPVEQLDAFMERAELVGEEGEDDDSAPGDPSINISFNVDSAHQVRKLLFDVLNIGKGRSLKLTKGGEVSTGKRQMEALKRGNGIVQDILDYRERSKLKGTYTSKFPKMARLHPESTLLRPYCPVCGLKHWADTHRIHTQVLTTRTTTGRPATKNPNFQNIPVRSKHGREVRKGFVASPGTELVTVDFGQLELRILAHVAQVKRMIEAFICGDDIHTVTAMGCYGFSDPKQVDKLLHRAPAKNVNFAIVYGETPRGLLDQLVSDSYGKSGLEVPDWLTLEWCEDFMEKKWHKLYPEVKEYLESQYYRARRYGVVWSLFGRCRKVPEVRSVHKSIESAGLRQAGNMPIQGSGADMLKLAQAEIQDWIEQELRPNDIWCWPVNEVHDELIFEVEEGLGKAVKKKCEKVMVNVMQGLFRVPIEAEGKVMQRWEKG